MTGSPRNCRIADTVAAVVFTLVISFPMVSLLLQRDLAIAAFPIPESLAELPDYHKELKRYFAASMNVRRRFAGVHSRLKLAMNGPSKVGGVTVGKDGWLYLDWMLKGRDFRIQAPLSHESLVRSRAHYEKLERECRQRNLRYLLVLIPTKQAVYPEFLPDALHDRIGSDSKVENMFRFLNAKSTTIKPLNLLPVLRESKVHGPVYFQTDTHWTSLGGFVASQAINEQLRRVFPDLPKLSLADVSTVTNFVHGGNEADILGRRELVQEQDVRVRYQDGSEVTLRDGRPVKLPLINVRKGGDTIETVSPDGQIGSAVIFHNSFGYALIKHLGRSFKSARWVWGNFSTEQLRNTGADVVIDLNTL